MRITQLVVPAGIVTGLLLLTSGCTNTADPNAVACDSWAKANNAWVASEQSPSVSSAELASVRAGLHEQLQRASQSSTADIKSAMTHTLGVLPANALHLVEPGSASSAPFAASNAKVQHACTAAGHPITLKAVPPAQ